MMFALPAFAQLVSPMTSLYFPNPSYTDPFMTQSILVSTVDHSAVTIAVSRSTTSGGMWLNANLAPDWTPASILVSVNTSGLTDGFYQGNITITAPGTALAALNIPVYLTVGSGSGGGALIINPGPIDFRAPVGSILPTSQDLFGISATPVTVNASAVTFTGGDWLSVSPRGVFGPATTFSYSVTANPAGLASGTYTGQISFSVIGGATQTVAVKLTVGSGGSGRTLTINPGTLSFMSPAGSTNQNSQLVTVNSPSAVTLNAAATTNSGGNWLSVSPAGSIGPATAFSYTVFANPSGMANGTYTGQVAFSISGGATQTLGVTFTVGTSSDGTLTINPGGVSLSAALGSTTLISQSISVTSLNAVTLSATVKTNFGGSWLSVSPTGSLGPATSFGYVVYANPAGLPAATYAGQVVFTISGGGVQALGVTFTVGPGSGGGMLAIDPGPLAFSAAAGSTTTSARIVTVTSTTAETVSASAVTFTGGNWLSVSPPGVFGPAKTFSYTATANPTGLASSTYYGQISFAVSGGSTQTLDVTLTVGGGVGKLTFNPSSASIVATAGSTMPTWRELWVTSTAPMTLSTAVSTTSGGNWLSVKPSAVLEPTLGFRCFITADPTGLAPGSYTGQVSFSINGGATQTLDVIFGVIPGRLLSSRTSLVFPDPGNSNNPFAPQFLSVFAIDGSQVPISITTSGGTWLSAHAVDPAIPTFVQVSVNTSGLGNGTYEGAIQFSVPGTSYEPLVIPVSLTITAPTTGVTVATVPAGFPITVDSQSYFAPATFSWLPGSSHSLGTVASQSSNGIRNAFSSWSDGGSQTHTITVPSATATITANFQTSYLLTANVIAGSGGISALPSVNDGYYPAGATVQLTAQPSAGSQFVSWSGDASGNGNPIRFTMTGPRTVGATFGPFAPCTITLNGSSASISAYGDILRVNITAGSGCSWQSFSSVPWVTILSGSYGSGNGTVRIKVDANSDGASRAGTVSIAGIPYTLTQTAGGCAFQVSGPTTALPGSSAGYPLTIKASIPGCQWSAVASTPWVTLTSATTGSGNGTVSFSLANNSGADPRNGYIVAGGQWWQFIQKSLVPTLPFSDVPVTHLFFDSISLLKGNNISSGCGSGRFCPEEPMTRSEMAAFIIRALFGESFPFSSAPYFEDVGPSHPYFAYVQKLREIGVTNGCTATAYCPDATVTRGQMAAFLVRARLDITSNESFPFSPAPLFQDVSTSNLFFPYIQKMKQLGITDGCTATKYCPDDTNTRGQMSVFVVRGLLDP